MPLSELPLPVLVLIFLSVFVLIGLYPAWQRLAAKIRKYLERIGGSEGPFGGGLEGRQEASPAQQTTSQLNDFEMLVLWRLSQNGNKGLSRKQINANLHLESANLHAALESLAHRGMVRVAITSLFGIRFYLSEKGRSYSIELGFIPKIHHQKERF